MAKLHITQGMIDAIYSDPPPNPATLKMHATGLRREHLDLADIMLDTHARRINMALGTRFERIASDWAIYTAAADPATIDALMATRPDWEKRGGIWYNHVAKLRAQDGELILLIRPEAFQ